jgi:UDP-N-acetylglucosamine 2-epimerase (non-hydrolysing)
MRAIIEGLRRVADELPDTRFHVPLHPNGLAQAAFEHPAPLNLKLGPPLAYPTFLNKLAHCQAVLTDSGGVQEDACTLGIPCAVAREVTDRPESVASGHAVVVGREADTVETGLHRALSGFLRTDPGTVFGDGHAAERIAHHLEGILQ